ncbi:MAG: OmpA family protein [Ignavibacteriales bacterium]|nr:OmpA family protein [Ignavibacteriales bacterium]
MRSPLIFISIFIVFSFSSYALVQFDLKKKILKKADNELNKTTDKAIDDSFDAIKNAGSDDGDSNNSTKNKNSTQTEKSIDENNTSTESQSAGKQEDLKVYSKFTFVPGSKTIFFDDFSEYEVGDFPESWGTNGSGEIVSTNLYDGNWFSLVRRSGYLPNIKGPLPEQYTIEFDLVTDGYKKGGSNSWLSLAFIPKAKFTKGTAGSYAELKMLLREPGKESLEVSNFGSEAANRVSARIDHKYSDKLNGKIHFSLAVKKQRLQIWMDEEKIVDSPSLLQGKLNNYFIIEVMDVNPDKGQRVMISNFRIAEVEETFESLMKSTGKYSTSGIYFDVNKATVKAQSMGLLKQIGEALKKQSEIKIKIIGHTDSQGDDKSNQTLSEKRAESVKKILNEQFGISNNRMITEGKGESEAIDDNNTLNGRANNRRVEFIKQ